MCAQLARAGAATVASRGLVVDVGWLAGWRRVWSAVAASVLMGTLPTLPRAQTNAISYDSILEARDAFRRRDRDRLASARAAAIASGQPLAMWPDYWSMSLRIEESTPAEVDAFYRRWPGTYVEDRFRNDWLLELGKRRDWRTFIAEQPRFRMNDDRSVSCYGLLIQQQAGQDVRESARAALADRRDADEGCQLLASAMVAAQQLDNAELFANARMALATNRPAVARSALALVGPQATSAFDSLSDNPARYLATNASTRDRGSAELATLALMRAASKDLDYASDVLSSRWDKVLPADLAGWAWATIGRQAAFRLEPQASAYFDRAEYFAERGQPRRKARGGLIVNWPDDTLAWRIRALLKQANGTDRPIKLWNKVLETIDALSPAEQRDATWRYWKARALRVTAIDNKSLAPAQADEHLAEARQLLEMLAGELHFYGALASEDLGRQVSLPPAPAPLTAEERSRIRRHGGLDRALQLIAIGLRTEGVREWNFSLRGLPERDLLAAAQWACEREVWDRCINTSEKTVGEIDIAQRYPMPFRDEVVAQTRQIGLDAAYVYGLIRQESRFVMNARSSVGASGLMQIMPATAQWTARKIGLNYTPNLIDDRATNLLLGTSYLKLVLDDAGGQQALGAAAYNAGPGRMRRWREGSPIEAAVWAENIPFAETRDYVKKVLSNAQFYAARLSGEIPPMRRRLGPPIGSAEPGVPAMKDLP